MNERERAALPRRHLLAMLATLALLACAPPLLASPARAAAASTPAPGSALRRELLQAVKAHLGLRSSFKLSALKVAGDWAWFEGTEVLAVAGDALQETDLTVQALLRREQGRWKVDLLWSLPQDDVAPHARFAAQLRQRRIEHRLPDELFD